VIPKARGTASRLLQEAQGYKLRVENEAQGNVSRFNQIFAQYQKAPEVTRQRMYLDSQEQNYVQYKQSDCRPKKR
jgi:membrane protease subunit HflK